MLAGKVLCVARLYVGPRLNSGWEGSCVARLYGGPRLYADWEGYSVARLYGGPRLYASLEGSLCSLAIFWSKTVSWQGRFFVYLGYMVVRDCMLAWKVLCVARLYRGPRL